MAEYVFYAYSKDALVHNADTNAFDFVQDFDFKTDRIEVTIVDDDVYFDGDFNNSGAPVDTNAKAILKAPDGTEIARGYLYDDAFASLDIGGGAVAYIERLEIDGVHYGYATDTVLTPGQSFPIVATNDVGSNVGGSDTRIQYSQIRSVPCFGPGTMILTDDGAQPVEWLEAGAKVLTRDHGMQPLALVLRSVVSPGWVAENPESAPIVLPAGSLGPGVPGADLQVTANHRILFRSPRAELLFGCNEVFVTARDCAPQTGATPVCPTSDYTLTHLVFERHEIIQAEGAWVESFFCGDRIMRNLPFETRAALCNVLGDKADKMETARICLNEREAFLVLEPAPEPQSERKRA